MVARRHRHLIVMSVTIAIGAVAAEARLSGQGLDRIMEPYLRVHASLAADKLESVPADAKALLSEATKLGDAGGKLAAAAREVAAATDLKGARAAFGRLSEALLAYVASTKQAIGSGLHVVYCPMVKQRWVQKGTDIANPYFGTQMLRCGEIEKR